MSEKYDTDVTIWSPEGRLHQVKYATEAEKQGSACVGICNKRHVVLGAYRRRANEFADYQQKIMKIDDHIAIAVSGLTADARALASYMRAECMDYEFQFGTKMPVQSLVKNVADKEHFCTITYDRRPYGVGLMVGGRDRKGVHLFHTTAAGNYEEYTVHCIGARSQGARTYFNRLYLDKETGLGHVPEDETPENMIMHVLESLKGCVQNDEELTKDNCSIAIVGTEEPYHLLSEEEIQTYLDQIKTNDEKEETMEVDN